MPTFKDRTGERVGRLKVVCLYTARTDKRGKRKYIWGCVCDCEKLTEVEGQNFASAHTLSCGCLRADSQKARRDPDAGFTALFREYRKTDREFLLSKEDVRYITSQNCHYCGSEPKQIKKSAMGYAQYVYNGIDRTDNSVGYVLNNVVPCCWPCNKLKLGRSKEEFLERIQKIYVNLFSDTLRDKGE